MHECDSRSIVISWQSPHCWCLSLNTRPSFIYQGTSEEVCYQWNHFQVMRITLDLFHLYWNVHWATQECCVHAAPDRLVKNNVFELSVKWQLWNGGEGSTWKGMGWFPVFSAAKQVSRYNLGSISLGSLVVPPIETLNFILENLRSKLKSAEMTMPNGTVVSSHGRAGTCCLSCLDWTLTYINRNAYIVVRANRNAYIVVPYPFSLKETLQMLVVCAAILSKFIRFERLLFWCWIYDADCDLRNWVLWSCRESNKVDRKQQIEGCNSDSHWRSHSLPWEAVCELCFCVFCLSHARHTPIQNKSTPRIVTPVSCAGKFPNAHQSNEPRNVHLSRKKIFVLAMSKVYGFGTCRLFKSFLWIHALRLVDSPTDSPVLEVCSFAGGLGTSRHPFSLPLQRWHSTQHSCLSAWTLRSTMALLCLHLTPSLKLWTLLWSAKKLQRLNEISRGMAGLRIRVRVTGTRVMTAATTIHEKCFPCNVNFPCNEFWPDACRQSTLKCGCLSRRFFDDLHGSSNSETSATIETNEDFYRLLMIRNSCQELKVVSCGGNNLKTPRMS